MADPVRTARRAPETGDRGWAAAPTAAVCADVTGVVLALFPVAEPGVP
ncbi:hypothetical protein [Amycolatopsis sp. NPDC051371]